MAILEPDDPDSPFYGVALPSGNAKPVKPDSYIGCPERYSLALVSTPGAETCEHYEDGQLVSCEDGRTLEGEKSRLSYMICERVHALLAPTDWYVVRYGDPSAPPAKRAIPQAVLELRTDLRKLGDDLQHLVDAATDLAALDTINFDHLMAFDPYNPES